jgi:integrase
LPDGLTPHSLRRTFASLLYAIGEPATVVMRELGHTHPGLALRIYAAAMRRDDNENERLRALIDGGLVTSDHSDAPADPQRSARADAALRSTSGV